jgi:hypothetical protein
MVKMKFERPVDWKKKLKKARNPIQIQLSQSMPQSKIITGFPNKTIQT